MIASAAQYQVTRKHLLQVEEALANLTATPVTKPAKLQQLDVDSVQAKIDDFRREIAEYERPSSDVG
jgi:hypothetical protein